MDVTLHIGVDDTDSPKGGCTTYIAALAVELLVKRFNAEFIDYPNLIRLNPNVPWKTRGNGAVCLRVRVGEGGLKELKDEVVNLVRENADLSHPKTSPAVAFCHFKVPPLVTEFAKRTIQGLVSIEEAERVATTEGIEVACIKGRRGIVGALAAVGETLMGDHTYELITYRKPENRGTPRRVDPDSVRLMTRLTYPLTFNNMDPQTGRILLTPHGPDPILYGIRGENPNVVKVAQKMVKVYEDVERWVIFRTNQGTDAHLKKLENPSEVKPYHPVVVRGVVSRSPVTISGGHVILTIKSGDVTFDCAAYEPTGDFRKVIRELTPGDEVEVYGGVRPRTPLTINLEKLKVLKLVPRVMEVNPRCQRCGKRMKSMGVGKGFKCVNCGMRVFTLNKEQVELPRNIKPSLYIPPPRAQRHLTKPYTRYGIERCVEGLLKPPKDFWGLEM